MYYDDADPNFIVADICIIYTAFKYYKTAVDVVPICQIVFYKPLITFS